MVRALSAMVGICVAVAAGIPAVSANATPVNLTGSYSGSAGSISGNLQGSYVGDVLTLSPVPYSSTISIDLATPPIPLPNPILVAHGSYCGIYNCTVRGYLNEHYTYGFTPWNFEMGGSVSFDDSSLVGGTANLTATPIPVAQIGYLTGTATPTFTVTPDQGYGLQQFLADAAATTVEAGLNLGNWHVSVDGAGVWDSVDPGAIVLSRTDSGGLTTLGVSATDMMLDGSFSYTSDLTFDNSIVNLLGSPFISLFRDSIDSELTDVLIGGFNGSDVGSISGDEYAADCSASKTGSRSAAVSCVANANFAGSFRTSSPTTVPEPATAGLLGLGLSALIWLRRRRSAV